MQFVSKLSTGGKHTLVYPKCVREAVRERFGNDPASGAYDHQYEDEVNALLGNSDFFVENAEQRHNANWKMVVSKKSILPNN